MNSQKPIPALMLPGGGARGAYQVGVIQAIMSFMPDGFRFPVINGTSAGAINAVVMATHAKDQKYGVARLHHFWSNIHCEQVYRTDSRQIFKTMARVMGALVFGRLGVRPPDSLLDNQPLAELLSSELKLHQLQTAIDDGDLMGLSIAASSYDTAVAKCFYQAREAVVPWHRSRRVGLAEDITVEHIMASTALPFLFPAQLIGHEYYGDGGLRNSAPLSPAIHLGADRILVIGTRDESPIKVPNEAGPYPSMGELGGYMLDTIFMDTMMADLSRLNRINQTLRLIPPEKATQTHLKQIETLIIKPSVDVRDITAANAAAIPKPVRSLLKMIGGWGKDWRMPSYLLFEPSYTEALIELGHEDALAQQEQIKSFLAASKPDNN
ncbi:patatin-like phospholipase family protein [Marinicella sp. S1101]|uniref:patatin-like phospholipase family protein n=1 Tax=Marinicella marina TaxID=2996016 RepID=UPI0022610158|nr:patatin-like phospholipase family protein [Marinicella marina]MCX7552733.1 patatin-like phospholipase family protein [Marinicella marina]MDJ1139958.1 patatin-like phospholipase family protein [Marinicella marina]